MRGKVPNPGHTGYQRRQGKTTWSNTEFLSWIITRLASPKLPAEGSTAQPMRSGFQHHQPSSQRNADFVKKNSEGLQCEWSSHVSTVQSTPRFLASNDRWVYYHIYSVYIDNVYPLASSQCPFKILEVDTLSFPHSPKAAKRFQIDQHIRKFYKRNQFSLQVDQSPQDELKLIHKYICIYTHLDLTYR